MARPDYRSAAHFEAPPVSGNSDLYRFIAIYGGDTTRVFLDPSPAQLKLTQSDDACAIMALRQNPSSAILAHQWSWPTPGDTGAHFATGAQDAAMNAPHIQIVTVEAGGHDEAVGGLCAQKLAPKFAAQKATIACHKMTNIMSWLRHIMLIEVTDPSPAGAGSDQAVVLVDLSIIISCVTLDLATLSVPGILLHCIQRCGRKAGLSPFSQLLLWHH